MAKQERVKRHAIRRYRKTPATDRPTQYEVRDTVRNQLKRSFPNPGDDIKITAMFNKHVDDGSLGIPQAHRDGGELFYAYPVVILAARR
jgi:hypothetical protein